MDHHELQVWDLQTHLLTQALEPQDTLSLPGQHFAIEVLCGSPVVLSFCFCGWEACASWTSVQGDSSVGLLDRGWDVCRLGGPWQRPEWSDSSVVERSRTVPGGDEPPSWRVPPKNRAGAFVATRFSRTDGHRCRCWRVLMIWAQLFSSHGVFFDGKESQPLLREAPPCTCC